MHVYYQFSVSMTDIRMHMHGSYDVYATTLVRMQRALLEACDAAGAQVSGDGARDPDSEVVANEERFVCIHFPGLPSSASDDGIHLGYLSRC